MYNSVKKLRRLTILLLLLSPLRNFSTSHKLRTDTVVLGIITTFITIFVAIIIPGLCVQKGNGTVWFDGRLRQTTTNLVSMFDHGLSPSSIHTQPLRRKALSDRTALFNRLIPNSAQYSLYRTALPDIQ